MDEKLGFMLKDEFEALMELLDAKKVQNIVNVQELLLRVFNFFRRINEEFAVASKEEKNELISMLSTLQKKLQARLQEFSSEIGLSEDQIQRLNQDFGSLPAKYKDAILATKNEIEGVRANIKQHMAQKQATPNAKPKSGSQADVKKKPKRDREKWTKS